MQSAIGKAEYYKRFEKKLGKSKRDLTGRNGEKYTA